MFEDYDENEPIEEEEAFEPVGMEDEEEAAAESSNRTFMYVAIGMGALIIISLICLIAYVLMNRANGGGQSARDQRATENASVSMQQTEIAFAQQATETAFAFTNTPTTTSTPGPTNTPTTRSPTNTPVVIIPTGTDVGSGLEATSDPRMVTLTALYAQLTQSALTPLAPTSTALSATALPDTGFFDDLGVPQLFALAGLALILIFLIRRLRTATG